MALIYSSYKDDHRLNADLTHQVTIAFRDCSMAELEALCSPISGIAVQCSWPPTLYDIATFRKARRDKLAEKADFEQRHGGEPSERVSDEWLAHKQERLMQAREVWPDAWIDWSQNDELGQPGAIVSSSHRIQLARIRQRQEWKPFRPYAELWEAFIDEPEIIAKLENKLPPEVRGFEALRNAHKTHPPLSFDNLTRAWKLFKAQGLDAARDYILQASAPRQIDPATLAKIENDTWSSLDLKTPPAPPRSAELKRLAEDLKGSEGL